MNNLQEHLLSPTPSSSSTPSHGSYSLTTKLSEANLASFFERVESIALSTDSLRQAFHSLQQEQAKLSLKISPSLPTHMHTEMESILAQARSIKLSLDALDIDNAENRKLPEFHENSSVDRVRVFVTNSLRRKLKVFMDDFDGLRKKMEEEHRDDVRRRVFALTGQIASEEVVEEMLETGETEEFLKKAIEEQGKTGQLNVVPTVVQIQERNESMKRLEQSLVALHQLFLDMSVLVDVQGEELNDIERNMLEAMSFVKIGIEDLDGAVHTDRARRVTRTWIIFILILGLLIAIAVALLVVFLVIQKG